MATELRDLEAINIELACDYDCANCERYFECNLPQKAQFEQRGFLPLARENLKTVKRKILVLGGKGGVGKSMLAVNLAAALYVRGKKVCVLDQNYDVPAVPVMLGVAGQKMRVGEKGLIPVEPYENFKVVSMGLVLDESEFIIWFHDSKRVATEEFLTFVDYGEIDYMVIDVPAGTSSETVNVLKLIPDMDGSVVITVPSEVSQNVARRAILISRKAGVPVLGVVENMGMFVCPDCGEPAAILRSGGGKAMAEKMGVPFLGTIPMDVRVSSALDNGKPFVMFEPELEASKVVLSIADMIIARFEGNASGDRVPEAAEK